MSPYAPFVQTCWEEHRKHPDASVNLSECSKECSEGWKTMSAEEKGKLEDMTKADKPCSGIEMKTYIPPEGVQERSSRIPLYPGGRLLFFSCFLLSIAPNSKGNIPAYPLAMSQRNRKDTQYHVPMTGSRTEWRLPGRRGNRILLQAELKESLMWHRRQSSRLGAGGGRKRKEEEEDKRLRKEDKTRMMNRLALGQFLFSCL